MLASNSTGATALVIGDNGNTRQSVRTSLEGAGFRVEEACSGKEGLSALHRVQPDLIILEMAVNGFETCAALRNSMEARHTPILAVTALQDTASIHQAFEAGATDFICTPIRDDLLAYRARFLLRSGTILRDLIRSDADNHLLRAAVDSLPIGITISNPEGKITYTNPAEATMHGFTVEELLRQDSRVFAPRRLHRLRCTERLDQSGAWGRESVNQRKDGEEFPVQLSSIAVHGRQGEFLGMITACEDITLRKKNEAHIQQLAYYDTLTGLPNRTLFLNRLQAALVKSGLGTRVAILFLDLDNFKDINDTQGHDFGDNVIQAVARRLSGCIRSADTLARLGGDEFVIMLAAANAQEVATLTAVRIMEIFSGPFDIGGRKIAAGISIGIAIYPDDAADMAGLLRSADSAMYEAKANGRKNFQFFSAKKNRNMTERVAKEGRSKVSSEGS